MIIRREIVLLIMAWIVYSIGWGVFHLHWIRYLTKLIPPAVLMWRVADSTDPTHTPYSSSSRVKENLFKGLQWCLFGDLCLMFDDIFPPLFHIGLWGFLIAHILFGVVFRERGVKECDDERCRIFFPIITILTLGAALFIDSISLFLYVEVIIYGSCIISSALLATQLRRRWSWSFGAMMCLLASDLILIFHLNSNLINQLPYPDIWVITLYWIGLTILTVESA
jgi:uncharacterized membrane protein YhhN